MNNRSDLRRRTTDSGCRRYSPSDFLRLFRSEGPAWCLKKEMCLAGVGSSGLF